MRHAQKRHTAMVNEKKTSKKIPFGVQKYHHLLVRNREKQIIYIEHISNREEQIIETQDEPQWIEA